MKVFLTGYPGFIGRRVVRALVEKHPKAQFRLLVERRLKALAAQRIAEAGLADRCELWEGDLVEPDLGLGDRKVNDITHVWHLAAIYDLAVDKDVAWRVNVDGTRHILDFCRRLPKLKRHVYFSTCYVAGNRRGRIYESELDRAQTFGNHYESTKFWAEVEVRKTFDEIPTTIIRPSVVVGDSKTGETDKYDGPYYMIQAMERWPSALPLPMVGQGTTTLNIVPVDYVVDGAVALSDKSEAVGKTFQLADPHPVPVEEVVTALTDAVGRPRTKGRVPLAPVEFLMRSKSIEKILRIPRQTVGYMAQPFDFDTAQTQALLADTDVSCPPLSSYASKLVEYMRRNPTQKFLDQRKL